VEGAGDVHEVGRLATMVERARGDSDVVGEEVVEVIERGDMIRRLQKLEESGHRVSPTFSFVNLYSDL